MVAVRKYKRNFRRKRFTRKTRITRRVPYNSMKYSFKLGFKNTLTALANASNVGNLSFKIDDCPSNNEYLGIYDWYKIRAVSIKFYPRITNNYGLYDSVTNKTITGYFGMFTTAIDKNDATDPSSTNELLLYPSAKSNICNRSHKRYFSVRSLLVGQELANSNTAAFLAPHTNGWIRSTNNSVRHYGLKYVLEQSSMDIKYDYIVTMYCQFKRAK